MLLKNRSTAEGQESDNVGSNEYVDFDDDYGANDDYGDYDDEDESPKSKKKRSDSKSPAKYTFKLPLKDQRP